jgi:plastocyanin
MRKSLAALAALVLAVTAVLAVPAFGATRSIKVADFFFVRSGAKPTVTVRRGTTVKWLFRGRIDHNVTVTRGPVKFHSRTKSSGDFTHRMTRRGTYRIVCTIHPGMAMTLRVR